MSEQSNADAAKVLAFLSSTNQKAIGLVQKYAAIYLYSSLLVIFFLLVKSTFPSQVITREVVRNVPVIETKEVVKEVCSREAAWKELKLVDDKIILVASKGFSIVSEIFAAFGESDAQTAQGLIAQLDQVAETMKPLADQRLGILSQLGYSNDVQDVR